MFKYFGGGLFQFPRGPLPPFRSYKNYPPNLPRNSFWLNWVAKSTQKGFLVESGGQVYPDRFPGNLPRVPGNTLVGTCCVQNCKMWQRWVGSRPFQMITTFLFSCGLSSSPKTSSLSFSEWLWSTCPRVGSRPIQTITSPDFVCFNVGFSVPHRPAPSCLEWLWFTCPRVGPRPIQMITARCFLCPSYPHCCV